MNQETKNTVRFALILGFILGAVFGLLIGVAYAEPQVSFNTKETSYGQLLIIRGTGFTDGLEYSINLIMPNGLERILQQGLVSDEIGYQLPVESDAVKGTYQVIIKTETESAAAEFEMNESISVNEKEPIESDNTPYAGNVASNIDEPTVEPQVEQLVEPTIPSWVREVFIMWANGQITDTDLINGIEYLISIGVIEV